MSRILRLLSAGSGECEGPEGSLRLGVKNVKAHTTQILPLQTPCLIKLLGGQLLDSRTRLECVNFVEQTLLETSLGGRVAGECWREVTWMEFLVHGAARLLGKKHPSCIASRGLLNWVILARLKILHTFLLLMALEACGAMSVMKALRGKKREAKMGLLDQPRSSQSGMISSSATKSWKQRQSRASYYTLHHTALSNLCFCSWEGLNNGRHDKSWTFTEYTHSNKTKRCNSNAVFPAFLFHVISRGNGVDCWPSGSTTL